jgi:hypothetical protein
MCIAIAIVYYTQDIIGIMHFVSIKLPMASFLWTSILTDAMILQSL